MPQYVQAGDIPHKRHTQFRDESGRLRVEELFSSHGFGGPYALLYHARSPVEILGFEPGPKMAVGEWKCGVHRNHMFQTGGLHTGGDPLSARRPLMFNDDIVFSVASPDRRLDGFYRNALFDELIIVAEGHGELHTPFGRLDYEPDDLIVIPRGTIQDMRPGEGPHRLVVVESKIPITIPSRYFAGGQFAEHSPFCERDFKIPQLHPPTIERGDFRIWGKFGDEVTVYRMANHPFDVVGWDGSLYPYAINLRDFEPLTRRIHTMPDEQQAFAIDGVAAICCVVPRLMDYHPNALPAPPVHSSIDCDEVMIYLDTRFMGWSKPTPGVMTFHPRGLLHGPKAGVYEATIGMKEFDGRAVLIDTFKPLRLAGAAEQCDDGAYHREWLAAAE
jgi:homogentisate 1,2-dioxygenase